jgi:hypothetical protein
MEGNPMKKLSFALAAAAALVVVAATGGIAPADAQVTIRTGEGGVGVRVGPSRHEGYRARHGEYRAYGRADCRTEIVRKERPNGTVVVRKTRICD